MEIGGGVPEKYEKHDMNKKEGERKSIIKIFASYCHSHVFFYDEIKSFVVTKKNVAT